MTKHYKNIYQRILGVMEDVEYIQKGDKKVNGQYRFVSHDQVSGTLHKFLVKHGICVIPHCAQMRQDGNRSEIKLNVKFVNAEEPNDIVEIETYGHGIDNGDKGIGKAYSYAYKYALLKTFCLETGDDPDNDAQTKFEPGESPKPKYEPMAPPTEYQLAYFKKELETLGVNEETFFVDFGLENGWQDVRQHQMKDLLHEAREKYSNEMEPV